MSDFGADAAAVGGYEFNAGEEQIIGRTARYAWLWGVVSMVIGGPDHRECGGGAGIVGLRARAATELRRREQQLEARAVLGGHEVQGAAEVARDPSCDCQTEAAGALDSMCAEEGLEDLVADLRVDARSVVGDQNAQRVPCTDDVDGDAACPHLARVLEKRSEEPDTVRGVDRAREVRSPSSETCRRAGAAEAASFRITPSSTLRGSPLWDRP